MANDILDDLRDWQNRSGGDVGELMGRAADEIEALRLTAGKARQDKGDDFRSLKDQMSPSPKADHENDILTGEAAETSPAKSEKKTHKSKQRAQQE